MDDDRNPVSPPFKGAVGDRTGANAAADGQAIGSTVPADAASAISSSNAGDGAHGGKAKPRVAGVGDLDDPPSGEAKPSIGQKVRTLLIGRPRDLGDQSIFTHVSLVAFLAWVGLGADGLSSSCYGPPEAFANLGPDHRYLAVFLAAAIMGTVFIISACYSHIIEAFPSGGGGYLVASKLLGKRVGVVSGCALLVDYVMTITVSIASAGDAIFSLLPAAWIQWKLAAEAATIVALIVLNLRGIKESIQVLMPIFLVFLLTHFLLIVGSISMHLPAAGAVASGVVDDVHRSIANPSFGMLGMLALMLHAYSLGAGTYTGLEAVSNSMPVIREPRVQNAKRTMLYMACSLSFTAGGLIIAYLLLDIRHSDDKTMNYLLTRSFVDGIGVGQGWLGPAFLLITLLSEGALLVVGAQAGFVGGPPVLGYMAHDSWAPRWFSSLSERLATENGIILMGASALGALWYTHGEVKSLVVMYSINVFVTFSLSMVGMCRHWWSMRGKEALWRRRLALFILGAVLCVSILSVTVVLKFREGGWITLAVTGVCIVAAFSIHRYYRRVGEKLKVLDEMLEALPAAGEANQAEPDPTQPTAVILVGGYTGLGVHTMLNVVRFIPNHFRNFVFVSVGVVDSGNFKGSGAVEDLEKHTKESLQRYVDLARRLGMSAGAFCAIGTDAVDELEKLCMDVARKFPKSTVFAGQLVFEKDTWLHRFLHNQTAFSLQRRLQWAGLAMVILPTRVR
jgi:amino acid transporter